jgi:hypothetical protein
MKLKFSSPIYATYDMKGRILQAFENCVFSKIFHPERLTKLSLAPYSGYRRLLIVGYD